MSREDIVIVRTEADAKAFKEKGFRNTFSIYEKRRGEKPIYENEAIDIINMLPQFSTVYVVAKDTPDGKKFALEAFRLIGPSRAVRWLKIGRHQAPADRAGDLHFEMHESHRR